jgi:hypothetical protein
MATSKFSSLPLVKIAQLNGIKLSPSSNSYPSTHTLRQQFSRFPGGFGARMTESEALELLSIRGDEIMKLNRDLLKKKHRKCMLLNHPDRGGSAYLAMKINEAKEVLEKSYMFKG